MIKLVEVLTKEKSNLYPGPWPPEDLYVLVRGRGGGKEDKRIIHGYSQPWTHTPTRRLVLPSSLHVIVSTDTQTALKPAASVVWPRWLTEMWCQGLSIWNQSSASPYKQGGSGGSHLPKASSQYFPACSTTCMSQPLKNEAFTGWPISPHAYWGRDGPAPQCLPAIPHTQSWLCQYQTSGCNKGLKPPWQALWHSGNIPCQLKLKEKQGKSLLSEFKSHFLRTSMTIEVKRSNLQAEILHATEICVC